jgi:hypothetical protein
MSRNLRSFRTSRSARTRHRATVLLGLGAALLVPVAAAAVPPAPTVILNGNFEADAPGSSALELDTDFISGWTVMNQVIDLGVTEIAGCPTVDTQDYSLLRDFDAEAAEDGGEFRYLPVEGEPGVFRIAEWDATPIVLAGLPVFMVRSDDDDDDDDHVLRDATAGLEYSRLLGEGPWADGTLATELFALRDASIPGAFDRADDVSAPGFFRRANMRTYLVDFADVTGAPGSFQLPNYFNPDDDPYDVDDSFGARSGKAILLFSDVRRERPIGWDGYVARGPAVYSDVFRIASAPRSITLDWAALGDSDDYAVLGYLVDVDTCEQTEIIDAAGLESPWTSSSVTVSAPGNYRFVFVSGTFDKTFGGVAGALFFIDNIAQTAVFSEPGVDLELAANVGDPVDGTPVQVSGGGLKPTSPYTLTLRSEPVVLVTGTTDASGNFFDLVPLPPGIAPGVHTLTLVGIAPDDTELTRTASFTVAANGTFGAIEGVGGGSGGAVAVASSPLVSLACTPAPVSAGGVVTCNVSNGPPGVEILWNVIGPDGTAFAGQGVTLGADGSASFSFRAPSGITSGVLQVVLVDWLAPLALPVGDLRPTSVRAGGGHDDLVRLPAGPLAALAIGVILAVGAPGMLRRDRRLASDGQG